MFDKCIDHHKKPACFWLHVIGVIIGIWGLWMHNWTGIIVAIVLMILGHLFVMGGQGKETAPSTPEAPPAEGA